jgi:hypothetical protein
MRWGLSDSLSCVRVVGSNVVCGVYVRVRYCVWVYGRYDGDVAQLKVVYITRIRRSDYSIYLARYRYYCFSNKYTLHLLSYTVL